MKTEQRAPGQETGCTTPPPANGKTPAREEEQRQGQPASYLTT